QRRAPVVARDRRPHRRSRRVGLRRDGAVAAGPRRDRHRLVLRRLVEGEARARMEPGGHVRRRQRAHRRGLPPAPEPGSLSRVASPVSRIRVVDLARRTAALEPELSEAIAAVLASGVFLLGPETEAFEAEFAAFCGRRHAIAVASGTEALRLALVAMDVGAGHEVIVPAMTAVPTAAAGRAAGAVPVFADVDETTATLDAAAAARAVTDRTRAVIPVHLYGRPATLPDLGVPVLEDAAQAHGAVDPGSPSVAAAYSFYPTKNLGGIGAAGAGR